jgi:hypothetical protein
MADCGITNLQVEAKQQEQEITWETFVPAFLISKQSKTQRQKRTSKLVLAECGKESYQFKV